MADGRIAKVENQIKFFWRNVEDKEKEKGSLWRKNHTDMCGRVWFEPGRIIDQLEKWLDDNMLKVVNKNNQISYHEVKETHLDEECHRQSDWWNLG